MNDPDRTLVEIDRLTLEYMEALEAHDYPTAAAIDELARTWPELATALRELREGLADEAQSN